ncbi:MAG: tetratricopeptide repeat protein [Armatimonadetes bacterium]|nr:tetratricopeptide repeat protein [Armatimonadota bacterium]
MTPRSLAPLMAALSALLTSVGCGPTPSLLEPDRRVVGEIRRFGSREALARAELRAADAKSADAYTRLAQTRALVAASLSGQAEKAMGEKAAEALDRALKIDPGYLPAVVQKADILLQAGQPQAAERLLRRLPPAALRSADSAALLARALAVQGRPAEAEVVAREALQTHRRDPRLHWALAVSQALLGQSQQAEESFVRAIELAPRLGRLRLAYAEFLRSQRRHEDAARQALVAVELAPESIEERFVAGTELYMAGRLDEAVAQFREALVIDPDHALCANNLALVLADEQLDTASAVAWARRAVQAVPDDPKLIETLGWALARDGQYEQALRILKGLQKRWPEVGAIHYHLGWTLVQAGQRTQGMRLLRQAAASDDEQVAHQARQALEEFGR